MSLVAYQRALYDLISNPLFCMHAKNNASVLAERYELSPKEQRRLTDMLQQKGMSANCTLYRFNRFTPLYTLLPYTCKLLDAGLLSVLESFWVKYPKTAMQFKDEAFLFYQFLQAMIDSGEVMVRYLEEILNFEITVHELKYGRSAAVSHGQHDTAGSYKLQPNVRIVPFRHHPSELFRALINMAPGHAPAKLIPGKFYLLLEQLEGETIMTVIPPETGFVLTHLQEYNAIPIGHPASGWIVENKTKEMV